MSIKNKRNHEKSSAYTRISYLWVVVKWCTFCHKINIESNGTSLPRLSVEFKYFPWMGSICVLWPKKNWASVCVCACAKQIGSECFPFMSYFNYLLNMRVDLFPRIKSLWVCVCEFLCEWVSVPLPCDVYKKTGRPILLKRDLTHFFHDNFPGSAQYLHSIWILSVFFFHASKSEF